MWCCDVDDDDHGGGDDGDDDVPNSWVCFPVTVLVSKARGPYVVSNVTLSDSTTKAPCKP